jgi:hypothetical protein
VQLTAAWVRRKRFEALLIAQALSFGMMARPAAPAAGMNSGRDAVWDQLLSVARVEDGDQTR